MNYDLSGESLRRKNVHRKWSADRRQQRGIQFPKASEQPHVFIIRLDLISSKDTKGLRRTVQLGLKDLCILFERLDSGKWKIDKLDDGKLIRVPLRDFSFSATVGFGVGFFDKLGIPQNYRPTKIKSMPNNVDLGDIARYTLPQTDLIIQLGSKSDFINRWVFENDYEPQYHYRPSNYNKVPIKQEIPSDIVTAVSNWATVIDCHVGFQRLDGRNLMGFNDGVSNPRPDSDKFNDIVWTAEDDERPELRDGTYMVFQKIMHDLDQWKTLSVEEQELWVGRNKITGLLLGTPENDDREFIEALKNDDSKAKEKLKKLLDDQSDPDRRFYDLEAFRKHVPTWSHIRKANPREEQIPSGKRIEKRHIFRRGYLFLETGLNNKTISGLLFISFQRDIEESFEFIKKNRLNNKNFPTPSVRPFNQYELRKRHSHGRFSADEIKYTLRYDHYKRRIFGMDDSEILNTKLLETGDLDTQNTGREGLSGPSELGVTPVGDFLAVLPLGGGYYFVPPVPIEGISYIGQEFFKRF